MINKVAKMSTLQLSICVLNHDFKSTLSERMYTMEWIRTMMEKEMEKYKCNDYILRHKVERKANIPRIVEPSSSSEEEEDFVVNELCRQKMCEWSYRIVDHCKGSRELVAIAQNYVDRFLDQYQW